MIVFKIILFILLVILGIILLLLIMPIRAEFSFIGEKVKYCLKYAFITVIDSEGNGILSSRQSQSAEKIEHKKSCEKHDIQKQTEPVSADDSEINNSEVIQKKPDAVNEISQEKESSSQDISVADNEKAHKKTPGEKVGFIMDIWNSAKRPLKKILKGFHINNMYIDFLIADEDACKCAIKYGQVCTALYNILAQFGQLFDTSYKTIDLECGFGKTNSRWDVGFNVSFLPITAVISGIWFLITYIFRIYLPGKRKDKKSKKSAKKQNTQPQGGM